MGSEMIRIRVLVVDDLAPMLSAISALLHDSFDVVGMVSSGQAALEATRTLEPELIVLDVSMPGMNGIEVARELKRRAAKAKIVFLTVHEDSEIVASCLNVGALGFVTKALMKEDLISAMNDALADRIFVSRFSSPEPGSRP
jgi:two-component system, NarL family, response regulator NreC